MASDFVVKWELGRGAFGVVYLIEKKDTKEKLALKTLDLSRSRRSDRDSAKKEAALLRRLDNPYVVSYVTSYVHGDLLCIITEFCEGGNLGSYLEKNSPLPEDLIVSWTAQITMALEYLHKENVLHRDLKPPNIYLIGDCNICVGDLGIARVLEHPDAMATTIAGTPLYMSPEILQQRPYSSKADIWSLGCVVFEMAAGQAALREHFRSGKVPSVPSRYSVPLRSLVTKMVDKEPQNRPDASSLLKTSPIKDYLVTPRPPLEIMKATRTALRDEDVKVPMNALDIHRRRMKATRTALGDPDVKVPVDSLQIHRRRMERLEGNVAIRARADDEIRLLLVGSPGAGKSATGNTIAGEEVFKEYAVADPKNTHTNVHSVSRFGKKIRIVDTPGCLFTDEPKKIPQAQWNEFLEKAAPGPHAIVLVVSAVSRFTLHEVQILARLKQIFHEEFEKFCVVVFTLTETWKRQKYTVETFFQAFPKNAQDLLSFCMAKKRAVAFRNSVEDDSQAQQLLEIVEKIKKANENQFFDMELLRMSQESYRGHDAAPNASAKHPHPRRGTSAEGSHIAKGIIAMLQGNPVVDAIIDEAVQKEKAKSNQRSSTTPPQCHQM